MQLRWKTKLTCQQYINQSAWEGAELKACPFHLKGGCGIRRHGTYVRVNPQVFQIPRWYCRKAHRTVSLLPDFAAASLPGTLLAIEASAEAFEQALTKGSCIYEAAQQLRPAIGQQGALRWIKRRLGWVRGALTLLMGCCPDVLTQCELKIIPARQALNTDAVLLAVRHAASVSLRHAPWPVGLAPRGNQRKLPFLRLQHAAGPDPPASLR